MIEKNGTPGVIRTPDPLLRRQVLYPAELRAHAMGPGGKASASHPLYSLARVRHPVNPQKPVELFMRIWKKFESEGE